MDFYITTQVPIQKLDRPWMRNLTNHLDLFNEESDHILAYAFNEATWYQQIVAMIRGDIIYAMVAFLLIVTYCSLFLGSCSPIQCRLILALAGVFCVLLSATCGEAICYMTDWKGTEFTQVLPILMLGIGVDDMFVVCNAIDQTSFDLSAEERVKRGMRHAGPSITITSLTDAIAFFIGSNSSLLAISSMCTMAGVMVILLYTSVLTIFLPFVVWDT